MRALLVLLVSLLYTGTAYASGDACAGLPGDAGVGSLPLYWMIPFAGLLLSIAIVPMIAGHWWHHNRNQLLTAVLWAAPIGLMLGYYALSAPDTKFGCEAGTGLMHAVIEYVSFIALLGSLFIISGGILLKGDLQGKPAINTAFLAFGAVISNVIGTTGASMLLIQPMLRTNAERKHTWHIPIFFIFLVSNVGGALTPIGDPPLFLGYLRGVEFFWTLTSLWWIWLPTVVILLGMFFALDTVMYGKESAKEISLDDSNIEPLGVEGTLNFLLLGGVIAAVLLLSPVGHGADEGAHKDDHAEHAALSTSQLIASSAHASPETHSDLPEADTEQENTAHTDEAGAAHQETDHDAGDHDHQHTDAKAHADSPAQHHGEHPASTHAASNHGEEADHLSHPQDGHGSGWSMDPRDYFLREIVMGLLALLSLWITAPRIRERNKFEYGPILEVAALFVGIFVAMIPATAWLQANGGSLGLTEPIQFFWITGALSAFLDNAPTYVTFASVACGIDDTCLSANDLFPLTVGESASIMMAISLGAVFLGAGSYIGNGPNFMVRAIAENYTMDIRTTDADGNEVVETVKPFQMPSFFGYIGYAAVFLLPVFGVVSFVVFYLM